MVNLPNGAQRLIELRLRDGSIPDDLVLVSLVGPLPDANPVVLADGPEYNWRWVRGLQVCIFGKVGTPNRQVAIAIGQNLPARLWLWDVEAKEGADVSVHIRSESLDKPARQLRTSDWTAIVWPWSEWQNKNFNEGKA